MLKEAIRSSATPSVRSPGWDGGGEGEGEGEEEAKEEKEGGEEEEEEETGRDTAWSLRRDTKVVGLPLRFRMLVMVSTEISGRHPCSAEAEAATTTVALERFRLGLGGRMRPKGTTTGGKEERSACAA